MLSESQLAMLRKEALVAIGCNISSSPRLIDVLLSLDVHVVQKVMWAGIHSDCRACRTLSNNRKLCLECFNSRSTGTLYRRTQGSSLTGLESSWANQRARCFYLKSDTGMAKEAVAGN